LVSAQRLDFADFTRLRESEATVTNGLRPAATGCGHAARTSRSGDLRASAAIGA